MRDPTQATLWASVIVGTALAVCLFYAFVQVVYWMVT